MAAVLSGFARGGRVNEKVLAGVIMGSQSDWNIMQHAADTLDRLGIPNETRVISAHRTPDVAYEYAASAAERGLEVIIAGAGMAAALPGVLAAKTTLPVLGVPIAAGDLMGIDALLAIVQMPPGIPVGTLAVGKAGAVNAAFFAAAILGLKYPAIRAALDEMRAARRDAVLSAPDPRQAAG
ncbi:MAG: 5-(carboxyamino)imidazole ribonucleotide mutase [Xanthomonadales bacterium]|nr:5-(carboxyamino)imidazole ribonucleotide mutase [Xanthomonadales bacterium]NIN59101.1 5-(carboxyamino)imidazole ribonucleotide mutase [Xanthomonadales bacterium]NIN74412.1 5-(carboxyamino)imidazole ribonucleotide mutase [Xanthomonadales bacterium]NIO13215.1 5-(carboxyamino)imidazole ribonucleotide mutase [Xanthomonadales bacterium]NIP11494.1 5-(carboxyamino)imidazole ribonucleotide mutase [Xanthomonadales bacterium]